MQIIEEEVKIISLKGDEDNGMVTTWVTMTEIIGTEIMMARIVGTKVGDGMAKEVKVIVIGEGEEDGTQIPSILNKSTHNDTQIRIITITETTRTIASSSKYMSAVSKSRLL